jgi:CO dehydrogenase/acetyl-CoA synthase delta subunit
MEDSSAALTKGHDDFGKPLWPAVIALTMAVTGTVLMFLKRRIGRVLQIIICAIGALSISVDQGGHR